jgi:hypothetical protein
VILFSKYSFALTGSGIVDIACINSSFLTG